MSEGRDQSSLRYAAYIAGLNRAAQIARYYLKHQNFPCDWEAMSEHQKAVQVTAKNIDELIRDETKLSRSESMFSEKTP